MSVPSSIRFFIAFFISVCFANFVISQSASITGLTKLKGSNEPLPGISIALVGSNLGAATGSNGNFSIQNIPAGDWQIHASGIGFVPVQNTIKLAPGQTFQLVLELEESVMGLPAVVVQSVSLTGGMRGLRNVPGSAHYISPQELEKFSYTDINRTLRSVPGVNLQEEDGFGLRPNIGLRGAGAGRSSKITLMEDGVLAAPAPYAAPAAYYFPTIGRMQAVEILKGSSQVRFGPFTTGGAINLISTPVPTSFAGRLHLLGGSFGNRNLHAYAGDSQRNFGYLVETFQYKSDGFKDLDGGGETGFDKKDFLAKFNLNTGPKAKMYQSLGFKAGQTTENSDETYLGLTQADFDKTPYRRYAASQKDRMDARQEQYSVRHLVQFTPNIDMTTTAYYQKFHRNWYKLDKVTDNSGTSTGIGDLLAAPDEFPEAFATLTGTTSPNDDALAVKANNRNYQSQGVQTVFSWRFLTAAFQHTLDLGLRYHSDEMDRFQWTDEYRMENGVMMLAKNGKPGTESNRIESAKALASYVQFKTQWKNWTLIPGLRHEKIRMERKEYGKSDPERTGSALVTSLNEISVFIPGIGLDFKATPWLNVFVGVHKGFSPASVKEGSLPEESVNYELGSRFYKGAVTGTAVLFYNDYKNLLGADLTASGGTGSNDLFNGGKAKSQGLEFQMTWDGLYANQRGWSLPLSIVYTYTDASFQSSFQSEFEGWGTVLAGDGLPYVSKHQLAVTANASHGKFSTNLSGRYQGSMRTVAGQAEQPDQQVGDFVIVDVNASYQLHPKATVFTSISNLANEVAVVSRHPAGLRPTMPRTWMAGLKINF